MLEVKEYKRSISMKVIKMFLDKTIEDYEKEGLKTALDSIKGHIEYRRNQGQPVKNLNILYEQYL